MLLILSRARYGRLLATEVAAGLTSKKVDAYPHSRFLHTSPPLSTFWERDKKSGYKTELPLPSKKQLILDGFKELKSEIALWREEMKEKLATDPLLLYRPGKYWLSTVHTILIVRG